MLHYIQELIQQLNFNSVGSALLRVAAVFLCLTVHEISHGLAAYALGDPTAKSMHRLSLNPLRHIDWVGLAMMLTMGFGWAKPVPVDPRYFKKPKQGMAVTALAGPISNFILALLLIFFCKAIDLYTPYTDLWNGLFGFDMSTAILSVGLGLFNLVPIPPLDGSKVLAAFLPDRLYMQLMRYERYGILVLLALSFLGVGDGFISKAIGAVFMALYNLIF